MRLQVGVYIVNSTYYKKDEKMKRFTVGLLALLVAMFVGAGANASDEVIEI